MTTEEAWTIYDLRADRAAARYTAADTDEERVEAREAMRSAREMYDATLLQAGR